MQARNTQHATPKTQQKVIGWWLMSGCALIFVMVIIGGITRLTGSGLSITEWKPVMGAIPPLNEAEWQTAFEKYKQIPQFQKINYDFTLSDFKSIFWWEFIHRLIGRMIGVVFIIPFIYFFSKRMFDRRTLRHALFLFFLGALQGVIGWLMVKSGLTERTSVSHIRLAIHLITAFITFGFTFYFALEILSAKSTAGRITNTGMINTLLMIVIIQIIYGAFVAGMHAGKIYNTFPLMNGQIIPEGIFAFSPGWKNFFENQITVQFIHRLLAGMITIAALIIWMQNKSAAALNRKGIRFLLIALAVQISLGIATLLTSVQITLALLHQVGAFFLFASCIYLKFLSSGTIPAEQQLSTH